MSERSSVATEYIYCLPCAKAVITAFAAHPDLEYLHPTYSNDGHPIIVSAKHHGSVTNDAEWEMVPEIAQALSDKLCDDHAVRVAVMADGGFCGVVSIKSDGTFTWLAQSAEPLAR